MVLVYILINCHNACMHSHCYYTIVANVMVWIHNNNIVIILVDKGNTFKINFAADEVGLYA